MRSVTVAEAERNLAGVLDWAAGEPVRIQRDGRDVVVVAASEFERAQELLRKERNRALQQAIDRCAAEAKANGFTDEMLPELLRS